MNKFKRTFKLIPAPDNTPHLENDDMAGEINLEEGDTISGMYNPPCLQIPRRTEELRLSIEAPESPRMASGERKPRILISKYRLAADGEWDGVSCVEINPDEVTQVVEALNKYYRQHISPYLSNGAAPARFNSRGTA